jgi:hypothetical protein
MSKLITTDSLLSNDQQCHIDEDALDLQRHGSALSSISNNGTGDAERREGETLRKLNQIVPLQNHFDPVINVHDGDRNVQKQSESLLYSHECEYDSYEQKSFSDSSSDILTSNEFVESSGELNPRISASLPTTTKNSEHNYGEVHSKSEVLQKEYDNERKSLSSHLRSEMATLQHLDPRHLHIRDQADIISRIPGVNLFIRPFEELTTSNMESMMTGMESRILDRMDEIVEKLDALELRLNTIEKQLNRDAKQKS